MGEAGTTVRVAQPRAMLPTARCSVSRRHASTGLANAVLVRAVSRWQQGGNFGGRRCIRCGGPEGRERRTRVKSSTRQAPPKRLEVSQAEGRGFDPRRLLQTGRLAQREFLLSRARLRGWQSPEWQ